MILNFKEFLEQAVGGIYVGVRYSPETTAMLGKWLQECAATLPTVRQLIPPDKLHTTIVASSQNWNSSFKPLGQINQVVTMENPRIIQARGQKPLLILSFGCSWLSQRQREVGSQLNVMVNSKPHITLSYNWPSLGYRLDQWVQSLPTRTLTVVEEYATTFDDAWSDGV